MPVLGALVCASLIVFRVHSAVTSADPASRTAPLIAAAVIAVSLVLYALLKPKGVPEV